MGRYIKHALLYWIIRYWLESPLIWQDQDVQDFVFIELKKRHIFNYGNDINLKMSNVIHYQSRHLLEHWHKILSELIFSEREDFSFAESHTKNNIFRPLFFITNSLRCHLQKIWKRFQFIYLRVQSICRMITRRFVNSKKNHKLFTLYTWIHILI